VEVSFAERHKGAPLFCDTDEYMRRQQFMLANLHPSHWIRSNGVFDMFSQPQVIWSNALYLLGREVFLNRLKMCPAGHRKHLLSKFLIILLLYRFHDYACEIVFHARSRDLISAVTSSEATAFINAARRNGYLNIVKLILGTLSAVVALVVFLPIRQFRGSSIAFLKIQLSELCMVLLQFARCRLHGSLVDPSDPTVRL
jgi:hypothetical protein